MPFEVCLEGGPPLLVRSQVPQAHCSCSAAIAVLGQLSPEAAPGVLVLTLDMAQYQPWTAACRIASSTEASPLRTDATALPTTTRSAALPGEGNGGEGIGESDVMAAAYGRARAPVSRTV